VQAKARPPFAQGQVEERGDLGAALAQGEDVEGDEGDRHLCQQRRRWRGLALCHRRASADRKQDDYP
jgi:hypothetical protein